MSNRQWFLDYITFTLIGNEKVDRIKTPFRLRKEGVEGSKVELVENWPILGKFYFTSPQLKQTINLN